jgi:hypothetical protein
MADQVVLIMSGRAEDAFSGLLGVAISNKGEGQ